MYASPQLERFGKFRDLTLQDTSSKTIIGDDLIPGIGLDCDGNAPPGDPTGCLGRS